VNLDTSYTFIVPDSAYRRESPNVRVHNHRNYHWKDLSRSSILDYPASTVQLMTQVSVHLYYTHTMLCLKDTV